MYKKKTQKQYRTNNVQTKRLTVFRPPLPPCTGVDNFPPLPKRRKENDIFDSPSFFSKQTQTQWSEPYIFPKDDKLEMLEEQTKVDKVEPEIQFDDLSIPSTYTLTNLFWILKNVHKTNMNIVEMMMINEQFGADRSHRQHHLKKMEQYFKILIQATRRAID
jgi:hypothetical protein